MNTILFTRPEHDPTTHYLSNWSKESIVLAESKGIKVLDLNREKAIKSEVENRLTKFSPDLVILNGHGNENMVTGHKNEPLLIVGGNEKLLKNKIIYAISCRSAKNLGPKSISAGAINYTGYDDDFVFLYEPEEISRPLTDKTARQFLEHSQIYVESLIKGNMVNEALNRSKLNLKNNFVKALSENNTNAARFLWWDLKHFVSHGKIDAKLG